MNQVIKESRKIIATLTNLFKKDGMDNEFQVLSQGTPIIEKTGYNTWDGGRVGLPVIANAVKQSRRGKFRKKPGFMQGTNVHEGDTTVTLLKESRLR